MITELGNIVKVSLAINNLIYVLGDQTMTFEIADETLQNYAALLVLTHWGRVTHICVSKLTIIDRRQAIIWTNAGILLIGPLGTNFSEILIEILTFSFEKMRLKVSSAKRRPFCLGLNVLSIQCVWSWYWPQDDHVDKQHKGLNDDRLWSLYNGGVANIKTSNYEGPRAQLFQYREENQSLLRIGNLRSNLLEIRSILY